MLTQTTEHALRALLYLGRLTAGERASVAVIAEATGIPSAYLAKLLQTLAGRGWVESRLGRSGGFALSVPLDVICVADLIEQFAGSTGGSLCLLGNGACDPANPCIAHVRWSAARRAASDAVGRFRLSDLLGGARATDDGSAPAEGSLAEEPMSTLQEAI